MYRDGPDNAQENGIVASAVLLVEHVIQFVITPRFEDLATVEGRLHNVALLTRACAKGRW
jgi:hypothetical protein